tara:strand:+ start:495 stop:914 length:420 start_codon:yes stop_codon:yes gene_type:complete
MKNILPITFSLFLSGCGAVDTIFGTRSSVPDENIISQTIDVTTASIPENLSILSGIGGISILGGIVLLVVSVGRKGWWPILGGIGLVFINTLLQEYFHYIALPIIVASGVFSALWAIKALGQARLVKLKKGLNYDCNNK